MCGVMTAKYSAPPAVQTRSRSATKIVASAVGAYAGLLGIEHGFFETLQGNVATNGTLINAIGSQTGVGGAEPAFTIVPNFLITGILAIIISIVVIIWAIAFLERRYAGLILILLSIVQLLVGGGLAPIYLGIIAGLVATRINKPLTWWRAHLPITARRVLAYLWPWSLIAFSCYLSSTLKLPSLGTIKIS